MRPRLAFPGASPARPVAERKTCRGTPEDSRHLSPKKVRAFIDFLVERIGPVPPRERDAGR